jgi:hypothetical protein
MEILQTSSNLKKLLEAKDEYEMIKKLQNIHLVKKFS